MKTKIIKTFALALVIFCLGMCFVGCSNQGKVVELSGNFSADKSQYFKVYNTQGEGSVIEEGYDYVTKTGNYVKAMTNSYDINITDDVIYIAISRIYLDTRSGSSVAMSVLLKCKYKKSGNVINVSSTTVLSKVGDILDTKEKIAMVEYYAHFTLEAKKGYMELTTNFFELYYLSDLKIDVQFKIPFKPAKSY